MAQNAPTREQLSKVGVDPDRYSTAKAVTQQAPSPEWGTSSDSAIVLPAAAFTPRRGVGIWESSGTGDRSRTSQTIGGTVVTTDPFFDAPVNLPAGARITGLRINACDDSAAQFSDVTAWLINNDEPLGNNFNYFPASGIFTTGSPGCVSLFADLTSSGLAPFNHETQSYWVRFSLGAPDSTNRLRSAVLYYRLQVSPSPGTATFADVPTTHLFYQYIEALAAAGITSGCGGGNYCPDAALTRGQMAVFLSKALGLHWPN
jgi:S-layer family protein